MLIATLPPITRLADMEQIIRHPLIGGVRYNVGMRTQFSAKETLERIVSITRKHDKKLWIDLKGRQLRIEHWADPTYGDIVLNHNLTIDLPAKIIFRNGGKSNIITVNGNKIFVDPIPSEPLGAGQAVNVIGQNLVIEGYLTMRDVDYIEAAKSVGVHAFMLSYVEKHSDIEEVLRFDQNAQVVLKIESVPGVTFVFAEDFLRLKGLSWHFMVARDDLTVQVPNKADVLQITKQILQRDPDAIVGSHLFESLTHGRLSAADLFDVAFLRLLGYRHFLLSDSVSHFHFPQAMELWEQLEKQIGGSS